MTMMPAASQTLSNQVGTGGGGKLFNVPRLLLVRLGSVGDLVHTLPAVATLARSCPGATIDWLVDAVHLPFFDLVPEVTQVVFLESPTLRGWLAARRRLRARPSDAAHGFQGLVRSAARARLSGASRAVGFDRAGLREPAAAFLYTERVLVGDERHVIQENLRLLHEFAKRTSTSTRGEIEEPRLEFLLRAVESSALRELQSNGVAEVALIKPGAAWPNKRCRRDAGWCLGEITVAEVAAAVDERLAVRSEAVRQ